MFGEERRRPAWEHKHPRGGDGSSAHTQAAAPDQAACHQRKAEADAHVSEVGRQEAACRGATQGETGKEALTGIS